MINATASSRFIPATQRAVQGIARSHLLGKHRRAIAPTNGKNVMIERIGNMLLPHLVPARGTSTLNVMIERIGNMPLPPHRVIENDHYDAEENREGIIAHIAGLQAAQPCTCAA